LVEFDKDDVLWLGGEKVSGEELGELVGLVKLVETKCGDDLSGCYFM